MNEAYKSPSSVRGLFQKAGLYGKTLLTAHDLKSFSKALVVKLEDELLVERLGRQRRLGAANWGAVNFDISFYCDNHTVSIYYEIFGVKAYSIFPDFVPRKDDIVVDLGANQGIYTCYAAKRAPSGWVYAIEPDLDNLTRLKAHLQLNRVSNVTVVPKCVGDRSGKTFFAKGSTSGTGRVVETHEPGDDVAELDQVTLEDLMTEYQIPKIDLLKIDVEGSEERALSGAGDRLTSVRRIALEYHSPSLATKVERLLKKKGFSELQDISAARSHVLYFENNALCRNG